MRNDDKYKNFAELKRSEPANAWRIRRDIRNSKVLIIAPHGGRIEPGTSPLAALVAGQTYNLYRFEGRKQPHQNQDLHITSHRFDEPKALEMVEKCSVVLGIHGADGTGGAIYVGGLDRPLRKALAAALKSTGLRVEADWPGFRAENPRNICNRGSRGRGAQLELTWDLRNSREWRQRIAKITRRVIRQHLARIKVRQNLRRESAGDPPA